MSSISEKPQGGSYFEEVMPEDQLHKIYQAKASRLNKSPVVAFVHMQIPSFLAETRSLNFLDPKPKHLADSHPYILASEQMS